MTTQIITALFVIALFVVVVVVSYKVKIDIATDKTTAKKIAFEGAFSEFERAIYTCVVATNQTFKNAKKAAEEWNDEAKIEALQQTINHVMKIISSQTYETIYSNVGDFETYLIQRIEATVNDINAQSVFR